MTDYYQFETFLTILKITALLMICLNVLFKTNVNTETLDLLANFNYRSISEIPLCPSMLLFYTLQTIHRGNV
jgi:hypothetical protein